MAEGITLATAITIRPIVRLHRILTHTTAVQVTSADAGNFRKLSICLAKGLAGDLRNEVPFFAERICGFVDYISVVLMEIVLLHLKY